MDIKFSQLTAAAVGAIGATTTILPVSIDVTTTPLSRSITAGVLRDWLSTNFTSLTIYNGTLSSYGNTAVAPDAGIIEATDGARFGPRIKVLRAGSDPRNQFVRVNGTLDAPTAVLSGESIGTFEFLGYTSAATLPAIAQVTATALENLTGAAYGGRLVFSTVTQAGTASQGRWFIQGSAANVSELVSGLATARIVGGATNGLAIRNSGNTRDNFAVNDAGSQFTLSNGTQALLATASAGSGERTAGSYFSSSGNSAWLGPNASTVGLAAGLSYFDGSTFRSALEVLNVASGFGTLALMKSGGNVTIGASTATPGYLMLGQTVPTGGGLRIDASNYSGVAMTVSWAAAASTFQIRNDGGGIVRLMAGSSTELRLGGANLDAWTVTGSGSIATLQALQATARIVGGATNGLAIRDNTNTTDVLVVSNVGNVTAAAAFVAGAANGLRWNGRSQMLSGADGTILMTNNGATDFNLLQLGGTTGSFPAIQRNGSNIRFRTADNTSNTSTIALNSLVTGQAVSGGAGVVAFGSTTQTTVGAAGAASALPATPSGYLRLFIGTTEFVLPYYAQA